MAKIKKTKEKYPVFVYGSLRNGMGNYNWALKNRTEKEIKGDISGLMYSLGGFPAVVPTKSKKRVIGELMYIKPKMYNRTMFDLDQLEGWTGNPRTSLYNKVLVDVKVEGEDKPIKAWCYIMSARSPHVRDCTVVESGDWVEFYSEFGHQSGVGGTKDAEAGMIYIDPAVQDELPKDELPKLVNDATFVRNVEDTSVYSFEYEGNEYLAIYLGNIGSYYVTQG